VTRIYDHFKNDPHGFEHCAAAIAGIMDRNINIDIITRPSRDGGRDAVGIYRIGPASDRIKLDFALEAKCYALGNGVGVKDVARLISRLRYRQFGILVTTSHISEQAYAELRQDEHPVIVITGADIAAILVSAGMTTPESVNAWLESAFGGKADQ
jgi:hypothetical protein